jgi:ferredoxin
MNEYLVSGTARKLGAIGIPDNFQIEHKDTSSRNAYVSVRDALYNNGYEMVHVVAIKMRCTHCGDCHVTVPTDLYL